MTRKKDINEESQGQTSDMPELRKISPEQLKEILKQHKKWIESKREEGEQANLGLCNLQGAFLQGANLQGANFYKANLQGAKLSLCNLQKAELYSVNLQGASLALTNLQGAKLGRADLQRANLLGANLSRADLRGANLQGANLQGANLQKAELHNTILQDANSQNADLTNVIGLMGGQLAGADVTGAKLPKDILEFEALEQVGEASKNARKLFFGMLLGCVYSWLTIATTTDVRLLTNSASSPLPIIRTEIPIVGFFLIAPLILLSVYLYSHIYMQRLWEGLAKLPAVFPDGRALHERAYPWLLTGLVCAHFKLLKPKRPALSRIQVFLSIILAWWIIPITLLLFWARYLPRHEFLGITLHVMMVVISITAAIFLYRLAVSTLRGDRKKPFLWRKAFKDLRTYKRSAVVLGIVAIAFAFLSFSASAFDISSYSKDIWKQKVLMYTGIRFYADFFEANVSEKPPTWSETGTKDELRSVKGAQLKRKDLTGVNATGAFLVNADLREAKLRYGNFKKADLRGANLEKANLQYASFQGADFREANLGEARLDYAKLQEANFREVKNLSIEMIKYTNNWILAYYDIDLLKKLELPSNHNEILKVKDFSGYNFFGALLEGANLKEAKLREAKLKGTYLRRADLLGADLEQADLRGANLEQANLEQANLKHANLNSASLQEADLEQADLEQADLFGADLRGADLEQANLFGADLRGAKLRKANLRKVDLRGTKNLSPSEVKEARNWFLAYYDNVLLIDLEIPLNHNERVSTRNFSGYNFSGSNLQRATFGSANLQDANLQGVDFQNAIFWNTNLQGADLRGVKNFSVENLYGVLTLYKAKLDPELMKQVKKKYPHLLEKPKPKEKEKKD